MDLSEIKQETAKFDTAIHPEIAALLKHHMQLNFLVVAILAAIMGSMIFFGIHAMETFQKGLDKAEAIEQQYEQEKAKNDAAEKDNANLRAQLIQAQIQINNQINTISKIAENRKTQLAAATTPKQVAQQSQQEFNATPTISNDQLCYSTDEVKEFVKAGIERDEYFKELQLTKELLTDEQKKTASLTTDLATEKNTSAECQKSLNGYKKLAKHGKFRAFFTSVKHVAYITGAVAVVVGLHSAGVF